MFAGTDLNLFGPGLVENIQFRQLTGLPTDPVIFGSNGLQQTLITQQQSIPNSNSNDAGLFLESLMPVNKRLRVRSGGRVDFVRTSSDPRLITGNFDLFW